MILDNFSILIVWRVLWALSIIAAGIGLYWIANRLILVKARSRGQRYSAMSQGKPVLLYFTTPTCAPCKTLQRPAIAKLQTDLGKHLLVMEIDAAARPDVAGEWGVMSVPTTFLIDASGKPRFVNHGVASADKLMKQFLEMF